MARWTIDQILRSQRACAEGRSEYRKAGSLRKWWKTTESGQYMLWWLVAVMLVHRKLSDNHLSAMTLDAHLELCRRLLGVGWAVNLDSTRHDWLGWREPCVRSRRVWSELAEVLRELFPNPPGATRGPQLILAKMAEE